TGVFEELPVFRARPGLWDEVAGDLSRAVLLRSEGMRVTLGEPQRAAPELVAKARDLVRRADRFFRQLVAAYLGDPARRPLHQVNPAFAGVIERSAGLPVTLLSRFDCVLDEEGELQVIENNSVGICLVHLRNSL